MIRLDDGGVQMVAVRGNVDFRLPAPGLYEGRPIVLHLVNSLGNRTPVFSQAAPLAVLASGTATSVIGDLMLVDSTKSWSADAFVGKTLQITSGVHAGAQFTLSGNTGTGVVLDALFTDNPAVLPDSGIIGESYSIHETVPLAWVGRAAPDYDTAENARNIVVARAAGALGWIADGGTL